MRGRITRQIKHVCLEMWNHDAGMLLISDDKMLYNLIKLNIYELCRVTTLNPECVEIFVITHIAPIVLNAQSLQPQAATLNNLKVF